MRGAEMARAFHADLVASYRVWLEGPDGGA
jgi:hypothetical protein